MKTVADFKRRLALGVKLHATFHLAFAGRNDKGEMQYKDEDKGVREVSIIQTNSFALKTPKKGEEGVMVDSWCQYPKAKEIIINSENSISLLEEAGGRKFITYTFVE